MPPWSPRTHYAASSSQGNNRLGTASSPSPPSSGVSHYLRAFPRLDYAPGGAWCPADRSTRSRRRLWIRAFVRYLLPSVAGDTTPSKMLHFRRPRPASRRSYRLRSARAGIALTGDPDYRIVMEAYPFVTRKIISDESPALQRALKEILYRCARGRCGVCCSTMTTIGDLLATADDLVARSRQSFPRFFVINRVSSPLPLGWPA